MTYNLAQKIPNYWGRLDEKTQFALWMIGIELVIIAIVSFALSFWPAVSTAWYGTPGKLWWIIGGFISQPLMLLFRHMFYDYDRSDEGAAIEFKIDSLYFFALTWFFTIIIACVDEAARGNFLAMFLGAAIADAFMIAIKISEDVHE